MYQESAIIMNSPSVSVLFALKLISTAYSNDINHSQSPHRTQYNGSQLTFLWYGILAIQQTYGVGGILIGLYN